MSTTKVIYAITEHIQYQDERRLLGIYRTMEDAIRAEREYCAKYLEKHPHIKENGCTAESIMFEDHIFELIYNVDPNLDIYDGRSTNDKANMNRYEFGWNFTNNLSTVVNEFKSYYEREISPDEIPNLIKKHRVEFFSELKVR